MEEVDLEYSAPQRFDVPKSIIVFLKKSVPFEDSFKWIISAENQADFWNRVNNLPSSISFEAHKLCAHVQLSDAEFPQAALSPMIEQFWFAHQQSIDVIPFTPKERMMNVATSQIVNDILSQDENWKFENQSWIYKNEFQFDMVPLLLACDAYYQNSRPWLFLQYPQLRELYITIDDFLLQADPRLSLVVTRLYSYLRDLKIENVSEFLSLIEKYPEFEFELPEIELDSELLQSLSNLFVEMKKILWELNLPPVLDHPTQWEGVIGDALANQMTLSIGDRALFVMTPLGLAARLGSEQKDAFDEYSLADMMFSNGDQEALPLGYMNVTSEVPKHSPEQFITQSFEAFIAQNLVQEGFENVQEPSVQILVDVLKNELKTICDLARTRTNRTHESPEACINAVL
ncbi:hypothetical protein TVAG_449810 [Trichomonas vaginalis G3]|uniref:Uncharacterized protein n=1 Tax=Trichomonas vaginalis (strain ATCC PRA-98 / G3) TaxID=412133 RepID=A2F4C5_TRIV3|nr:hypothetical protein TVAGG3_0431780 [Trichomonas vaginalis G3]EAY00245.1 hypothetical protein TVAG_449810 [Trichomonas vaginalis G3]KAI5536800.1 hypothetical protein TVAGG3_0431780 [Trichomonas vaginalis G3]|eukprot:XP_001313174.1 hypothetical protein [Trichomonas vaginalis G3]